MSALVLSGRDPRDVIDPDDIEHRGNVLDRVSDVVLIDGDLGDIIDRARDLHGIFARASDPIDITDRIDNSGDILDGSCDLRDVVDPSNAFRCTRDLDRIGDIRGNVCDPGAIFVSGLYPSLLLTGRLKRQLSQLQRAG